MRKISQFTCAVMLCVSAAVTALGQLTISPPQPVATPFQFSTTPLGASFSPSLSADGRFVAFASYAQNLVPNQGNTGNCNIFVRDFVSNSTVLVSVSLSGNRGGSGNSSHPIISTNGQFVAFISTATNLVTGVTNASPNLYLRDLFSGTTTLETVGLDGTLRTGYCTDFSMTPDGRYLLFVSTHTNLTTNTVTSVANVYLRDHLLATTELITVRATNSSLSASLGGDEPSISDDGQKVMFHSMSADLGGPADNVFLRDRANQTTTCFGTNARVFNASIARSYGATISGNGSNSVFVGAGSTYSNAFYFDILSGVTSRPTNLTAIGTLTDISSDGRRILFHPSLAYSPSSQDVLVWDSASNTIFTADSDTRQGSRISVSAVLSSDGRRVAFISNVTNDFVNGPATVFELYVRDLDSGITRLVTTRTNGQPVGPAVFISSPVFSADGRFLAFACDDDTLVPGDSNHCTDVFLWSCDTAELQLVSYQFKEGITDVGACVSSSVSVSSNGQFVAFNAVDGALVPNDTNGWIDVFRHDTTTYQTTLVSADNGGSLSTDSSAGTPVISADGRYIAYLRNPGGANLDVGDVYWRDLQTGVVKLASTNSSGIPIGNATTINISPDGRYVSFQTSSRVTVDDTNNLIDVYAYDSKFDSTMFISGGAASYGSTNIGFSPDSRWLIFQTRDSRASGTDLGTTATQIYAFALFTNGFIQPITHQSGGSPYADFYTNSTPVFSGDANVAAYVGIANATNIFISGFSNTIPTAVCTNCTSPSLSFDGSKIAYVSRQSGRDQIFVKDLVSSQSNLVSVAYDQVSVANSNCFNPILSPGGRFVIFNSAATNLVVGDTNRYTDVFVRDLVLSNTVSLTHGISATPNYGALNPVLSADGHTVVFQTFSTDLASHVLTPTRTLFFVHLGTGDSDHDGMDDDWEMTYFGDLSHDGTADTDGDGLTDLQEFQAGTNPIDNASVLRCLTVLTSVGGATIYWSAIPGHSYRIEYKTSIDDPNWTTLITSITASTTTASSTDPDAAFTTQRFYRVTALP